MSLSHGGEDIRRARRRCSSRFGDFSPCSRRHSGANRGATGCCMRASPPTSSRSVRHRSHLCTAVKSRSSSPRISGAGFSIISTHAFLSRLIGGPRMRLKEYSLSPGKYSVHFQITFRLWTNGYVYVGGRPENDWQGTLETGRTPLDIVSNEANLEGAQYSWRGGQQSAGSDF